MKKIQLLSHQRIIICIVLLFVAGYEITHATSDVNMVRFIACIFALLFIAVFTE